MAIEKLQGMSTALSKYAKSGTVTCYQNGPSYCNFIMSYTGNANPVVFAVTGADLAKASSIQFNVPAGRTVLINVSGTSVKIQNAGFKFGNIQGSSTLWNLYEALYFETDSVTVPGSVLAPLATTMLRYGAMNGTLVAWSLDTSSEEFHWYPFHNNALVTSP
jgi:choice-of-anchor A domain-containing protein